MQNVPFFPYSKFFTQHQNDYLALMTDVCQRGAFILQKDLVEFEKNVAEYLGIKHCLGVANCTDALIIALRVSGLKPGDEVIVSSHTFIATAAAVHFAGGIPVPVDCGPDHMIDPKAVEAAITKKTTCLMPTQLNGRTCDMDALEAIAKKHGLMIVEDSAQGLGSKYKNRFAGTFGTIGSFSFYPAKILGCFGDGGAVITNNDQYAEEIYAIRDHGRGHDGKVKIWGLNSRLDNLQAAILNYQFKFYTKTIERRRSIATLYQNELSGLSQLALPPAPSNDGIHFDTYQNYEIEAERRDELKDFLKDQGVGTLIQWGGTPVHQFRELGFTQNLSYTDQLFKKCLLIPMNTLMTDEDAQYVCSKIKEFYSRK